MVVLCAVALGWLFRLSSHIRIPWRFLRQGVAVRAVVWSAPVSWWPPTPPNRSAAVGSGSSSGCGALLAWSVAASRIGLMSRPLRIATVNVNGVRAAFRKGMGEWLEPRGIDILAMQEVRAETSHLEELLGTEWNILHDPATTKGRAGVALASRTRAEVHRVTFGPDDIDSAGRWLEADYQVDDTTVTVASCYVPSGQAGTPKQEEKWRFLDAMLVHLPALRVRSPLAVVLGDLNVGHRRFDIRNWRGNVKNSGFLQEERAYFDRFFGAEDESGYNDGAGFGFVDVGRKWAGEVDGPYTWWSQRGHAFDNDAGWRIDYHAATKELAAKAVDHRIDRAATYDQRWSDHSPVIVDYQL
jgi:exodeoxyribonuclease-3